jgi:hypothetical protein
MTPDVPSDSGFGRAGAHADGSSVHVRGDVRGWTMHHKVRCGLARPVES